MSYTLRGNAMNLEDIRRDIAFLEDLERKAVAAADASVVFEKPFTFDEVVPWKNLYAVALNNGFTQSAATRLKNGIQNMGNEFNAESIRMGDLCHPRLWNTDWGRHQKGLAGAPNISETSIRLFDVWRASLGITVERTPPDWA